MKVKMRVLWTIGGFCRNNEPGTLPEKVPDTCEYRIYVMAYVTTIG